MAVPALSTRAAGAPLATSHLGCLVPPALGKLGLGLPPPVEQRLLRPEVERRLAGVYERGLRLGYLMRPDNRVAAESGVAPFTGLLDLMLGDLTLVTDTPEILGIPPDRLQELPVRAVVVSAHSQKSRSGPRAPSGAAPAAGRRRDATGRAPSRS